MRADRGTQAVPAAAGGPAAPALFVPVTVEAVTITYPSLADIWSWTPPFYANLQFFDPTDPSPFTPAKYRPDGRDFTGIILHWALPDGLTKGGQAGARGEIAYPAVPTRWLLTRKFRDPQQPSRWAFHSVIIASDYVSDRGGSPYPSPDGSRQVSLGRTWPLADWPGEAEAREHALDPPLTAVGPGDATYAAFAANVRDVLAVADPLAGVGYGPISYSLYGWYGNPGTDPLYGAAAYGPPGWQTREQWHALMSGRGWCPDACDGELDRAAEAAARWAADHGLTVDPAVPRTIYPARTLCHGLITDIAWFGPDGPKFSGVPTSNPQQAGYVKPKLAIGNSAADALAALIGDAVAGVAAGQETAAASAADGTVASEVVASEAAAGPRAQVVEIMEAFQAGLLPVLAGPDGQARADAGLQAGWFGSGPGGTAWRVVAAEKPGDPAGREAPPRLTPRQAALLTELNARQRALDQRLRLLAGIQSQVATLWWKERYIGENPPYQQWKDLVDQATGQARPAASALIGECRWLRQQRDTCLIELTDTLGELRLSGDPEAPFSRPNEPVLLISGARRGFKHGEDGVYEEGRLACRFTGQAVSGIEVTVGDRGYVVRGGQLPVPVPDDPDLPAELADLAVESMILDISNAPLIASVADPADPWPLLGAIRKVQSAVWNPAIHPALDRLVVAGLSGLLTQYGLGAIPSKVGVQFWSPPWSPLYLDWRIEYRPLAAIAGDRFREWAPPGDAPVPGPDDWSYRWTGTALGPKSVTIQGRTLLTPQQPVILAAQLERAIEDAGNEPGLRPYLWALRDAEEYLRSSDLLSQALSGFGAALLQRIPEAFRTAPGEVLAPWLDPGGVPPFVPGSRPAAQAEPEQFGPLRAGHLRLQDLWVVDDFGQVFDVFGAIGEPSRLYQPVLSPDLVTPRFPTYAMLRPRISQFARAELPMLSADADDREVDTGAATGLTPLCGWLLGHPLESGVLVYEADGTLAGELLRAGDDVLWWPAPEKARPPHGEPAEVRIGNRHLRGIVLGLLGHEHPGRALAEFLTLLSDAARATGPDGSWIDEELPVPVGRPLAVIRARFRYLLQGEPAASELWPDTGEHVTGGFEHVRLPVMLGSTELLDDGVVGYYINDDYQEIQSVYVPEQPASAGYVGQRRPDPALGDSHGALLTMVVTPHGTIHAVTGLLPVLELTVPASLTTPALRRMSVTLRIGPVVGDGAGTVLPLPAAADSAWSWLQYTDVVQPAGEYPVEAADATAHLADAAPVVREGWLKLLIGERTTSFTYAVTPRAVPCTTSPDTPASATFEITVYNGAPDPVRCPALEFQLPVGPGERDLTDKPGTITVHAADGTPWSVIADIGGTVLATPQDGVPVAAGTVLTFVVAGVQVVAAPGLAVIRVTETTDADRTALLAVSKVSP